MTTRTARGHLPTDTHVGNRHPGVRPAIARAVKKLAESLRNEQATRERLLLQIAQQSARPPVKKRSGSSTVKRKRQKQKPKARLRKDSSTKKLKTKKRR